MNGSTSRSRIYTFVYMYIYIHTRRTFESENTETGFAVVEYELRYNKKIYTERKKTSPRTPPRRSLSWKRLITDTHYTVRERPE